MESSTSYEDSAGSSVLTKDGASVRGGQGGGLGGGHGIGLGDGWKIGSSSTTPLSNGDGWKVDFSLNIFDVPSLLCSDDFSSSPIYGIPR